MRLVSLLCCFGCLTLIPETRQGPRNNQDEVILGLDVQEVTKVVNGPAGFGFRQSLHPGGAAEAHGRLIHYLPPVGINLHGAPCLVAKVEVELAVRPGDAKVNISLRPVEERLGLDDVERG